MRVLLTSAGLETEEIQDFFVKMVNKEMETVRALFIPVAAINPGAIAVLPKCMNDLLKCNILEKNITVFDLHKSMMKDELKQYDIVYLCGGATEYLLKRINETGFNEVLMDFIHKNGVVLGVSAGSLIFSNNLPDNLNLVNTKIDVHCEEGDEVGGVKIPEKANVRLTNTKALAIYDAFDMEIIG